MAQFEFTFLWVSPERSSSETKVEGYVITKGAKADRVPVVGDRVDIAIHEPSMGEASLLTLPVTEVSFGLSSGRNHSITAKLDTAGDSEVTREELEAGGWTIGEPLEDMPSDATFEPGGGERILWRGADEQ